MLNYAKIFGTLKPSIYICNENKKISYMDKNNETQAAEILGAALSIANAKCRELGEAVNDLRTDKEHLQKENARLLSLLQQANETIVTLTTGKLSTTRTITMIPSYCREEPSKRSIAAKVITINS